MNIKDIKEKVKNIIIKIDSLLGDEYQIVESKTMKVFLGFSGFFTAISGLIKIMVAIIVLLFGYINNLLYDKPNLNKEVAVVQTVIEKPMIQQVLTKQYDKDVFDYGHYKVSGTVNVIVSYSENTFQCYGKIDFRKTLQDHFSLIIDDVINENVVKTSKSDFGYFVEESLEKLMYSKMKKVTCNGKSNFNVKLAQARVIKQYNDKQ